MSEKLKKLLAPKYILLVVLLAVVFVLPVTSSRRTQTIMCMVCCYAALGISWNVLSGLCGMFSVTHAIFYGMGVYSMICAVAKFNQNPLVGFLIGMALNMVMALIIGKIGSKLSSLYFTMALIGVSNALYTLALQLNWLTGSTFGLSMGRAYAITRIQSTYIGIVMVIVFSLFYIFLRKSRMGTSLVALKDNPNLAMALGSNIGKWRILATLISAGMASIVGVYYSFFQMAVTPDIFGPEVSLKILMVCIVGGIGNVWGPILGSVLIVLDEWIKGVMPSDFAPLSNVIYALVLIVMLQLKPNGLASIRLPKLKKKRETTSAT